jgi:hypothetical protein
MEELQDYSGDFKPDLKMQDFSKDALTRLWLCGAKLYMGIAGRWYSVVRERLGEEMALELSREVWQGSGMNGCRLESLRPREAMNIWGTDVASFLKFLQVDPGAAGVWPGCEFELKNANRGKITIKDCLPLRYFERHGERELANLKHTCEELDGVGFSIGARDFNPKMKVIPLKLPPRRSRDEIACQWQVTLGE